MYHLQGVYSIKFNWRGEVSINPFLVEAIKYAKQKGILEVAINTNGLPKQQDLLIECVKSGLDRIIFSVDGFSKETFETVRIGANYEKLIENINDLLKYKKNNNLVKPFVRVQMVRTNVNQHEVSDYIEYWTDRVDDVRVNDVMDRGQGTELMMGDQVAIGRTRCPQPFQRMIIGRDGRVSPCCADWNQEYIIGDTSKESLLDIWNEKKMAAIRKVQDKVELDKIDICKNCYVQESYLWKKK